MILSLTSDKYDVPKLYDLASTILEQKLSQIQGVGQVFVAGAAAPAVRVEANPTKLESYGLTLNDIRSVLSLQNAHGPRGQIANKVLTVTHHQHQISQRKSRNRSWSVITTGRGPPLRRGGRHRRSAGPARRRVHEHLKSATLVIFRQPGANIIDTVKHIREQLPFLRRCCLRAYSSTSFWTAQPRFALLSATLK